MNKLNGYFYANTLKASIPDNEDSSAIITKPRVRTVFISDIHLGTPGCQAQALLEFLRAYPSEQLYLVGDIIDGWQLRQGWYWPQAHNDVIQKLLRRVRKGYKVVYVPGNHDEFARQFLGHSFGGIEVVEEVIYQTVDRQINSWITWTRTSTEKVWVNDFHTMIEFFELFNQLHQSGDHTINLGVPCIRY